MNKEIVKNSRQLLSSGLLTISAVGLTISAQGNNPDNPVKEGKNTPNIIVILADDLGYGDLSCYGATKISTPAVDALADNGMRFTQAYATSSLSSPSRYSLLTGRYAWRTRLEYGVLKNYEKPLIETNRTTLASMLKKYGYYTACVGKWHLGFNWQLNHKAPANPEESVFNSGEDNLQEFIDFTKPVTGGPTELGFDFFFGMSGSNNMQPYVLIENDRVLHEPTIEQTIPYDFYANAKRASDWDIKTLNQTITHKAVEVINNHFSKNKEQPLFLYFPTSAIHRPCLPTFTKGKSKAGLRGDIVVELDWTVNEIIKVLKENNEYENTLIIFTSDNGPRPGDPAVWIDRYKKGNYDEYQSYFNDFSPEYKNENGNMIWKNGWLTYGHSSSGNLLGFKQDPFEGGIRVPLIVHWPGKVKFSETNNNIVCLSDIMATFSELIGYKLQDSEGEDSYSFLSNILDIKAPQIRKSLTVASGSTGAIIEIKDGWKYIEQSKPGRWPETYYPNSPGDKKPRLFNLKVDISEQQNIFEKNQRKAAELQQVIEKVKTNTKTETN